MGGAGPRTAILADLRARIAKIEQHSYGPPSRWPPLPEPECSPSATPTPLAVLPPFPRARGETGNGAAWTFGADAVDGLLPRQSLSPAALHELKPRASRDMPSAFALALGLACRYLGTLQSPAPVLWVSLASAAREHGRLYAPGLPHLGFDPRRFILVEARTEQDALWAMEEGLRSQAVSLVAGVLGEAGDVPGRRLSLAAAGKSVPCLLLSGHDRPGVGACETRWRVSSAATPGASRSWPQGACIDIALERCRSGPLLTLTQSTFRLAWCHETHRFHSPSPLAGREAAAEPRRSHAS